ncbi:uncharacterized protein STEHIDRAFT_166667 [Stereum hirsutum FP-91666 SS1]|uniref:uncharacterized protein n=1 Tax=Stereum hirsutum (strain FP-91666) TaxID=721885 RepID=UPI0004410214|nr:uncharacterized protein STEHIDRAFT_166667 [Stereum hirsutum FP-91666 SS1]EIM90506.1 hypothetical protein STEHIDRAFT_166667 [Stereum hirsutum FP-91666 SS1]
MQDITPSDSERLHIDRQLEGGLDEKCCVDSRRRRNSLAPISRLPLCLLTAVFLFFPATDPETDDDDNVIDDNDFPTLLSITHVCHFWRKVALDSALLWTNIMFLRGPQWRHATLHRSKSAPLTILIQPPIRVLGDNEADRYSRLENNTRTVLPQLHRIKVLDALITRRILPELISSMQQIPQLPTLESFRLDTDLADRLDLPDNLLSGRCPRLRNLQLSACTFAWTTGMFPSDLTTLELVICLYQNPRPTPHELFAILRQLPFLQVFELCYEPGWETEDDGLYREWSLMPPYHLPVDMPNLLRLSIEDAPLPLSNLLQSLIIPAHATIRVDCSYTHSPRSFKDEMSTLLRTIVVRHDRIRADHTGSSLSMTWSAGTNVLEDANMTIEIAIKIPGVDEPLRCLEFSISASHFTESFIREYQFDRIMQWSSSELQMEQAVSLSFQGNFAMSPDVARDLFMSMGRIQTLELKDSMMYRIPHTLNHFLCADRDNAAPPEHPPTTPSLPALVTLHLHRVIDYGLYHTGGGHYQDMPTIHKELADFFESRHALFPDLGPVEILFHGAGIADNELQELEAVKGIRCARRGVDT